MGWKHEVVCGGGVAWHAYYGVVASRIRASHGLARARACSHAPLHACSYAPCVLSCSMHALRLHAYMHEMHACIHARMCS
eukprot:363526-Chlamydomonas_euryale.AAC.6